MASETITLLSTASIQDYIFRSNRLKENIGASWIVKNAIEQYPQGGRVLYVGGGNAALLFDSKPLAIQAVQAWSRKLVEDYPGLRVVVAHEERGKRDHGYEPLAHTMTRARAALMQAENRPPFGCELGALPVVRECASTGLAASHWQDESWLSTEAASKRMAAEQANHEITDRYQNVLGKKFAFPVELDKLGTEKGASQIAIIHADGDGIGKLVREQTQSIEDDNHYKTKLSDVSNAISQIANDALEKTLQDLVQALAALKEQGLTLAKCDLKDKHAGGAEFWFPLRPIVSGGDDLTFVCHGKLGMALASRYLRHFQTESGSRQVVLGQKLSVSAGVLIMPQKFPFARGYRLAEELTASAKQMRKLQAGRDPASWLDFQILLEGSPGSLTRLRAGSRFKDANDEICLLRRPYQVGDHPTNSWYEFEQIWQECRQWPRSRAKRLLESLVRGRAETKNLLAQFRARDIGLNRPGPSGDSFVETCIGGDSKALHKAHTSAYFDPLEALDFHVAWPEASGPGDKSHAHAQTAN
jgi:hypothetical protein